MASHALFPTFYLSGFESSTFVWKEKGRRDLAAETRHREHAREDYELLARLGIGVAREGIPWPFVDRDGSYDFGLVAPVLDAMRQARVVGIWDLCHYGYPDGLDPRSEEFRERFATYARAAAEHVIAQTDPPWFFTPINEITFFAFAAGEWGWAAPFGKTVEERKQLREALCAASIAGARAIRDLEPSARFVHIDPLVHVVAPRDRPDLVERARQETYEDTFVAWDIIAGKREPQLGGSLELLDVVGVNCYSFGQMEFREHGPHAALGPTDDRIEPLCDMLEHAWNRYRRPMIIAETSGLGDGRPAWLKDVTEETFAAVARGAELHGICLFPAVDMPNWHTGEWLHNGICDLVDNNGDLRREPFEPYVAELRRWQRFLGRVTELDEDPFSDPIDLSEIEEAARRLHVEPDKDWS